MSERAPLVSIGMPVNNGERFISQALDSLLAQTHGNFELIISDNASTDATGNICKEYSAKDKRIRYHRNDENRGAMANFGLVLGCARGEYFMWAASDDLWEPTYIERLLQSLLAAPNAVLAFSAFDNMDESGRQTRTYPHLFELPSEDLFTRLRRYMAQEEYLGKANLIYGLMQRSTIHKAGGFRVWGRGVWGMDMLVVFRLLSFGYLVLCPDLLFHKRLVPPLANSPQEQVPISPIQRLASLRSTLFDWHGYFSGYARIIDGVDSLRFAEKMSLRATLWRRAGRIYSRRVKEAFPLPLMWRFPLRRGFPP